MRIRVHYLLVLVFFLSPYLTTYSSDFDPGKEVKKRPTFHRRVEGFILTFTESEMTFFLDDLPYASRLLREYGIHSLTVTSSEGVYHAEDSTGLRGGFWLVKKKHNQREYMGTGAIENRIIGVITADVVAAVRYEPTDAGCIRCDLEIWVLVHNSFIDFLCRVFKPVLAGILKNKMDLFVSTVKQLAQQVKHDHLSSRTCRTFSAS